MQRDELTARVDRLEARMTRVEALLEGRAAEGGAEAIDSDGGRDARPTPSGEGVAPIGGRDAGPTVSADAAAPIGLQGSRPTAAEIGGARAPYVRPVAGDWAWANARDADSAPPRELAPEATTSGERDADSSPFGDGGAPVGERVAVPTPAGDRATLPRTSFADKLANIATRPTAAPARDNAARFELLVGTRWLAWAGALVVVLAVGLFIKLAADLGWFGLLTPAARCGLAAAFGGVLLGGGELTLRRIGRMAAVGLFAAGLGTLYVTTYAAFSPSVFGLISQQAGFGLLGAIAVLGLGITWRGRLPVIGVLSLLGGYGGPLLLSADPTSPLPLLIYMTTLLTIALGLSAAEPQTFRSLRYWGGAAHAGLAALWLLADGPTHWLAAMTLLTLWWVLLTAEAQLAAMRGYSARGNAVFSLLTTSAYVLAGCWLIEHAPAEGRELLGLFAASVAGLCMATATIFGPGPAVLRQRPRTALDMLGVSLWGQAGVLLVVAVALHFTDVGQTIGWVALAVAALEIGRRLPSPGVQGFALVVGALAVGRLMTVDRDGAALATVLWSGAGITITSWALLAAGAVVATHYAALRVRLRAVGEDEGQGARGGLRPEEPSPYPLPEGARAGGEPSPFPLPKRAGASGAARRVEWAPIVLGLLASCGWLGLVLLQTAGLTTTTLWLAGGAVLLAVAPWTTRQRYLENALLVVVVCVHRWLLIDVMLARLAPDWNPLAYHAFVNPQMGLGVLLAVAVYWAGRQARRSPLVTAARQSADWAWLVLGSVALLLVGASFEIDRLAAARLAAAGIHGVAATQLRDLLWTLLWTGGAATVGWLGWRTRANDAGGWVLRRAAAGVLMLAAVKWLLIDTLAWNALLPAARLVGGGVLVNAQMLAGLAVIAGVMWAVRLRGTAPGGAALGWRDVSVALLLLWGLSFEIDRGLEQLAAYDVAWLTAWPWWQQRALCWAALWAAGGAALLWRGLRCGGARADESPAAAGASTTARGRTPDAAPQGAGRGGHGPPYGETVASPTHGAVLVNWGAGLLMGATIAWMSVGTLMWRLNSGDPGGTVLLNLPCASAGVLLALLIWAARALWAGACVQRAAQAVGLALLVGLWLGSLEIDRYCMQHVEVHAAMARQMGLSVYWGVFGLGLVAAGFRWRSAVMRRAGLALLVLTLGKVLTVDLAGVQYLYRVLSLLATGLLLIAASLAYNRLAAGLDERPGGAAPTG
jgi:hypothetical protein